MAADARSLPGSTVSGTEATAIARPTLERRARPRRSRGRPRAARAGAPALLNGRVLGEPSTTMFTGSVAPLGKSRCSASSPCLATVSSGSASSRRRPSQAEHRGGERQQHDGGGDQADRRAAHDREDGAPPDGALLAGRRRDAPPEPRHPQPIDAVAEHHQQRRVEGQRDDDRDHTDDQGAGAEAAQRGVGHEQHRDHRQRERGSAEDHRARGGVRDGR